MVDIEQQQKSIEVEKMMYAIEMYFDKETEEKIMRLAQKIADAGLSTKYLEWKTRPHVTLAVYNDIDVDRCAQLLEKFANDHNNKGISTEDIADFVLTAVSKGKIIGYQGKGTGRPIYQVEYYGKTYKVAVTVGSNGYIVGANPR